MSENFTLRVHYRRDLRRALDQLSLNHDEVWEANSCDIGEAIIRLAVDNPNLLLRKLEQVQHVQEMEQSVDDVLNEGYVTREKHRDGSDE